MCFPQIVEECQSALAWLKSKKDLQARLGKVEDPVLLTADIKKKEDTLHRVAVPILSKPAPPPPKVSPPNMIKPLLLDFLLNVCMLGQCLGMAVRALNY